MRNLFSPKFIFYAFLETISVKCLDWTNNGGRLVLTLNIGNGLIKDLFEDLGILELLLNLGDDGVG
jgi:hypothetical protein